MNVSGRILLIVLLSTLGGCSAAAVAVGDNVLTNVNGGETCSVSKVFRGQAPYEDPEPDITIVEEPLHCYRTLGVIDCYRSKGPFAKIEGWSPEEKLQVYSPRGTEITGNSELFNSKRVRADPCPIIVRRSMLLELDDPVLPKLVAKKLKPKPAATEKLPDPPMKITPSQPMPEQPMGPVRTLQPPLKS